MVPPLPAASRPSNTMTTRRPFAFTDSCSAHSLPCRRISSFSYSFRVSGLCIAYLSWLPAAAERAIELGACTQLGAAGPRQLQLLNEQVLVCGEDLDVAREAGVVARSRQGRGVRQRVDADLPLLVHLRERLDGD